jgi:hypothetical protein
MKSKLKNIKDRLKNIKLKNIKDRLKNRDVLKEQNRVSIKVNQPVYSKDKSRFFKTAWEEEKRQLYFK